MSGICAGHHFVDKGFFRGEGPISIRWRKVDEAARRCKVSVFEDEGDYVAFTNYMGHNLCGVHHDPAEASLKVLTQMADIQEAFDAHP